MFNSKSINLRNTLVALFLFITAAVAAHAQVPAEPDSLGGYVLKQQGTQFVRLWWIADTTEADIDGFYVYKADGQTEDLDDFSLNQTVRTNGQREKYNEFMTNVYNLAPGTYTFYVTAYNDDGESDRSNFCYVTVNDPDLTVTFTSEPVRLAIVNQEYSYTAQAEASNGGTVLYRLQYAPDGMTINEETGEISWTPTERVNQKNIAIIAYLEDAEEVYAQQSYEILVMACTNPASLSGTVADEDGNPIDFGMAYLYITGEGRDSSKYNAIAFTARIEDGQYTFTNLDSGTYYLYLSSQGYRATWYENAYEIEDATPIILECGDDINVTMTLGPSYNEIRIVIDSDPVETARVNVEYTYDVNASAENDMELEYALVHAPDGAVINETTGVITWTPEAKGNYYFMVKAYLTAEPQRYAAQSFYVKVVSCENPSRITGFVQDEDGNPIDEGMVYIFESMVNDSNGIRYNKHFEQSRISDGYFIIDNLDEGTYYFLFEGSGFYSEWWENKTDMEEADGYEIECAVHDSINVTVMAKPVIHEYTVSGTVYDQEDNSTIPWMQIEFIGMEVNTNTLRVFRTHTNQNGTYEIELPDNYSYIARAVPMDSMRNTPSQNYMMMYYNQVSDPTEADVITLTGNLSGIDFSLYPRPVYENEIYGTVTDADGNPLENAWVVVYLVETMPDNNEWLYMSKSGYTNADGVYSITNLIPGEYVILAYSQNRDFVPGFYVENQIAARSWQDATRVEVTEDEASGDYQVMLDIRGIVNGHGRFHGWCGRRGGIIKSGDIPQGGDALAGALVFVTNENNKVVGWSMSGTNGEYSVDGMNKGIYKLSVDKVGYIPYSKTSELEDDNAAESNDFELLPQNTTSVEEVELTDVKVYPNPASDFITISFPAKSGKANITLVNALGNTVMHSGLELIDGTNTAVAAVSELPTGMYYIKIEFNGKLLIVPVAIAK